MTLKVERVFHVVILSLSTIFKVSNMILATITVTILILIGGKYLKQHKSNKKIPYIEVDEYLDMSLEERKQFFE